MRSHPLARRRASSSNRLPQPCIRIPVPSRRRAPIIRRASATMRSHPRDHSPHWPRRLVAPARPCIRMTRSFVASARLCAGPGPSSVRMPRPLPALAPTFPPVRRDHAPYPRDGALESPLSVAPTRPCACIVPLLRRVSPRARPKGTGHAPRGCRWSGLSPGPTGALT